MTDQDARPDPSGAGRASGGSTAGEGLVSAAEIARIAGVRPSAVSNWRRRHADFPEPARADGAGGAVFRLAEVERWLAARGRAVSRSPAGADLWRATATLRRRLSVDEAVSVAVAALVLAGEPRSAGDPPDPSDAEFGPVFSAARAVGGRRERAAACEHLLAARRRAQRRGAVNESDEDLAALILDLAAPMGGTVVDAAAGMGGLLLHAQRRAGGRVRLLGEERDGWAADIARGRLALHGVDARIDTRDALADTGMAGGEADVVLCDAPMGQRLPPGAVDPRDPRWAAGDPGRLGDAAWLQHAAWLARPGGRVVVATGAGAAHRTGRMAAVRAEMLRRGMVEAVVALPAGAAGRTARAPVAIWLLRPAGEEPAGDAVLLVDATRAPDAGAGGAVTAPLRARIVAALDDLRAGGAEGAVPGFAAAVPVLELLGPGAVLSPARWVGGAAGDPGAALEEASRAAGDAWRAAVRAAPPTPAARRGRRPAAPRALGDMIDADEVRLLRGVRLRAEDLRDDGVPLLTRPGLHDAAGRGVDREALPDGTALTRAGDVVVAPGRGGGARVLGPGEAGMVLQAPMWALRAGSGGPPPPVLAAALDAASAAAAPSFGPSRPRDLALALPEGADADAAAGALEGIDAARAAAGRWVDALEGLRTAAVEAAAAGALADAGDDAPARPSGWASAAAPTGATARRAPAGGSGG